MEITISNRDIIRKTLNEYNIPITKKFINNLFKRVGFNYKVKNIDIFQQAMVHTSYLKSSVKNMAYKDIKNLEDIDFIDESKDCMPLQEKSYERLEFLGDSILRHSIGKYLYLRYPDADEGFLSNNRSKLENKNSLSKISKELELHKYAVISRYIENANGRCVHISLTEDIFEAFIGALNLETTDDKTCEFIWKVIDTVVDMTETIRTDVNYKKQIMQLFHKKYSVKHDLKYVDNEYELNGQKRYKSVVIDKFNGEELGYGTGRSKQSAQQRAAKNCLLKLNKIGTEDEDDEYY